MKWKDLSFAERKQIYRNIRNENPTTSYYDIKTQFDDIPAYQDGKKPDWMRPVESNVSHWEQFTNDAGKVLSGLNKTVGTALTGASLGTIGAWNAARLLNLGTGSAWRLNAAKNALMGAKAGLIADIGNVIEDPSLTNAAQVVMSKAGSKDFTKVSNKIVNSISSGFDFDDLTKVPTYQDGKKSDKPLVVPQSMGYTPGTPEYFKRQQQISGRVDVVQPEAYVTPAGYIKDAINFVDNVKNGNYGDAAIDAALNILPWSIGKGIKKLKSGVSKANAAASELESSKALSNEFLMGKNDIGFRRTEETYQNLHADRIKKQYDADLNRAIWDIYGPDQYALDYTKRIDEEFGTSYADTYNKLFGKDYTQKTAYLDYTPIGKAPSTQNMNYRTLGDTQNGLTTNSPRATYLEEVGNVDGTPYVPTTDDIRMYIDPNKPYDPDVTIHELGHVVDMTMNGSIESGYTNKYLDFLSDADNRKSFDELKKEGAYINDKMYEYLSIPSEVKSHMLAIRRRMLKEGKLKTLMEPISKENLEENLPKLGSDKLYKLYHMYKDKNRFVDRMNKLIPASVVPIGVATSIGKEKDNKK